MKKSLRFICNNSSTCLTSVLLWLIITSIILIPQILVAQVITDHNHYKTWMAQPQTVQIRVQVEDQFMKDSLILQSIEMLSNPTLKVHNDISYPIIDPDQHLTWYRATGRDTSIDLSYKNQFESTAVTITTPEYLLLPAQKFPHDPPTKLDHYKAYLIPEALTLHTPVLLNDQFDDRFGFPENIDSLVPIFFLTPAIKNDEGPLYDSVTHYVAYQIFPPRIITDPPSWQYQTIDQFGEHILQFVHTTFLLVPSEKILPTHPPQDTGRNHYKTWMAQPQPFQVTVQVEDQFMTESLLLDGIEMLSNPTLKTHNDKDFPIIDTNQHLTWYRTMGRDTIINLSYKNQFESTAVAIERAEYLLVPAQKFPHGPPVNLDHYKAYHIPEAQMLHTPVILNDQFDDRFGLPENIDSLVPTFFLTPAIKNSEGTLYDSVTHYVAYQIFPPRIITDPPSWEYQTSDQFGLHNLMFMHTTFLLVPSEKILSTPPPPDTGKEHYKSWRLEPQSFDRLVLVEDQFMKDELHLVGIELLSNPSMKVHGADTFHIKNPDNHLTWYRAEGTDTLLKIEYENQFELSDVVIGSPEYLLVPTQKFPHDPPVNLDHYKAYQIFNPKTITENVTLSDQFDEPTGLFDVTDSLRPVYFLTPASKNLEPMYDTVTHYVAYEIFPKRIFQTWVNTLDQFDGHELLIANSDIVLVPTTKLSVGPPPDSLLGSLCGKKCNDINGNGVCDPGEPGLSNWTITLTTPSGGIVPTLTDPQGIYCFTGLNPGQYTLSETIQAGWQQTGPAPPGTYIVNLPLGQDVQGLDFANIRIPDFDSLLNHYKAWRTEPVPVALQAKVEDQIMTDNLVLSAIDFLANPVRKTRFQTVSEIIDPNAHLTWYRAMGRDTVLNIEYVNQFESTAVSISSVEYLLVPTQKETHEPPAGLDHYKAYQITDQQTIYTPTTLLFDQFDERIGTAGPIEYMIPKYFLTPASKNDEPMYDTVTHYVAYEIFPLRDYQYLVNTSDQFGSHELPVIHDELLLVPTLKLAVESPYDSADVSVKPGWNILSVAFAVPDYRRVVLFPSSTTGAFAYEGTYVEKETLKNGAGYWMKFAASEIVELKGEKIDDYTIDVAEGWNLIGSISEPILTSSITSIPGGIITSQFFEYISAYQSTDTLKPGIGYWVKVNQAGQLILSSTLLKAANKIRIMPTSEYPPLPPDLDEIGAEIIPVEYSLEQNYPNPFNPKTMISFDLPEDALVKLTVYNTLGQTVAVLLDGKEVSAGSRKIELDASSLPSGIYFYRLVATGKLGNNFTNVKKMLILK